MKNKKLYVGIDVSKKTIDVALLTAERDQALKHKQFDNDIKGYGAMMKWVKTMYKYPEKEMLFCMEHTGIYSLNLSCYLSENNISFWLENPLQIKRSLGIKRRSEEHTSELQSH